MKIKQITELVTNVDGIPQVDTVLLQKKAETLKDFYKASLEKFKEEWYKIDSIDRRCLVADNEDVANLLLNNNIAM